MKVLNKTSVTFSAEDDNKLRVNHANRGEPFREGIELTLDVDNGRYGGQVFLEEHEARELRDLLNGLYPTINAALAQIAALARNARPAHFADVLDQIEKIAVDGNKAVFK